MSPKNPLAGIDDIAWDQLTHAYGSADAVPSRLRGSLANDDENDDAQDLLISALWHQGSIYSATRAAIPFVVALLCMPRVHARGVLALWLFLVAVAARQASNEAVIEVLAAHAASLRAMMARYGELQDVLGRALDILADDDPALLAFDEYLLDVEYLELDPPTR